MNRVIRFQQFGPADVLVMERQPERPLAPGEVRVRVEAFGVSWADVLWRQDLAPQHARLPAGLGCELAGEVVELGAGVQGFALGDRVASFLGHSINDYPAYGERLPMPASSLVHYPSVLDATHAAVHYMPFLNAYLGLVEVAHLQPGQRLLVTDAGQCVGPATVQLGRALGAQVFAATPHAEDRDYLLALGAERVVVTEEEDLVGRVNRFTDGHGVDVAFDGCGGPQMGLLGDVMAPRGKLILHGLAGGNQTPFPACAAFEKNFKFFVHCTVDFTGSPELGIPQDREAVDRALAQINRLTQDGQLTTRIERVFSLDEVVEAHRCLESGTCRGRVVVRL